MNCDHCEKPAVVHEVHIRNGAVSEVHLCIEHAREAGKLSEASASDLASLAGALATERSEAECPESEACETAAPRERSIGRTGMVCRHCGLAFHQLRQGGVLGCPQCYEQFGATLGQIIERAQAGGIHHVGKAPRRGGARVDLVAIRQRLMRELEQAVAAEQYERAAKLRDRILALPPPAGLSRSGAVDGGAGSQT
ncbi:MAG TPA: UvrB/UvrC motif-containing protein [Phycisphaerales bacterium]|nr:UvrB/UvrC motif-containing protein [Phycisphaerales bacterium]HMP38328.1 UvrB/UvrC motif-containing protein [Phycisphaerales bacterium]